MAKLMLTVVGLATGLLLSEGLVRVILPQELTPLDGWDPTKLNLSDERLGHVHRANFEGPWARGIVVRTNSIGLRDREYATKEEGEIRVLSLGDSYAFGYGVELWQSYPKRVEKMLSERFPDCKISVINGAVSGYSTHQQILIFDWLHGRLGPDFILATFVGSNDVFENAVFAGQMRQRVRTPVGFFGQRSHLVRLILRVVHPIRFRLSNWWGPNIDYTIKLLKEVEGRFHRADLPYLMLIIPARHQIRPQVNAAAKWLSALGFQSLILRQNTAIKHHFEKDRVPFLDLHPFLVARDEEKRVSFRDDSHANAFGHQVMAEQVYGAIEHQIAEIARAKGCLNPG